MFGALAAVGGLMHIGGTALSAKEANKRRKAVKDIAKYPGLDFNAITDDALSGYESVFDRAAALSGRLSKTNQEALNAQEEMSLPGVRAAREKALGRISGLFDEDSAWIQGLQRRGAALGLSSGLRGSGAGQMQTLRLSDREGMQRTQLGTGLLGSLIGGMRLANSPATQAFLGPTISEQVNQRSGERTQRLNTLMAAAGLPTGSEMWGDSLKQVGGSLMGMGATGMLGGGGMLGGMSAQTPSYSMPSLSQQQLMMNESMPLYSNGPSMGLGFGY